MNNHMKNPNTHNRKVVGSNPAPATKRLRGTDLGLHFFINDMPSFAHCK